MRFCSVEGCGNTYLAKGFCRKHYLRLYKNGTLEVTINRDISAFERLMLKVMANENGCLIYQGRLTPKGYVHVRSDSGLMKFGHVIVYEHYYGPIPPGLETGHTCDNRACLNYEHLEAITHKENIKKAVKALGSDWGFGSLSSQEKSELGIKAANSRWNKN